MAQQISATPSVVSSDETLKEKYHENAPKHRLSPITSTEANTVPETAPEPQSDDVEKQTFAAEKQGGAGLPPPAPGGMMDPSSFPEGGLKAWTCVLGAFCCLFVSFGWINAIGIFQEYYQLYLLSDLSPSTISWIVSLESFFMFSCGPIIGKLYDNYGPRWILLVGSFLHVFGLMMASLSTQLYQLILSQGLVSPIGASMIFYPAMSSTITWFFRRRGLALGIIASGSSLGGVIFPIMVQRIIPLLGFPWTMRICAFLILFLLIIANLTIRSRIPPHPKPFSIFDFILPLQEPAFALCVAAVFCIYFGLFVPFNFVTLSGLSLGMDVDLSSYLIPILNAASVFGRILPGYLADKMGRYNIQILMCGACAVLVLALWLPSRGSAPIIVFSALYGFASGGFVSITPAIVAQISDVRQIGTRTGTMFALGSLAVLSGNPIAGAILSSQGGSYTGLQIFAGVTIAAGTALFLASKATFRGKLFKKF